MIRMPANFRMAPAKDIQTTEDFKKPGNELLALLSARGSIRP
jgi:hypothetical protein